MVSLCLLTHLWGGLGWRRAKESYEGMKLSWLSFLKQMCNSHVELRNCTFMFSLKMVFYQAPLILNIDLCPVADLRKLVSFNSVRRKIIFSMVKKLKFIRREEGVYLMIAATFQKCHQDKCCHSNISMDTTLEWSKTKHENTQKQIGRYQGVSQTEISSFSKEATNLPSLIYEWYPWLQETHHPNVGCQESTSLSRRQGLRRSQFHQTCQPHKILL